MANAPEKATIRFVCDGTIAMTPAGGGLIELATGRTLTLDGTGRRVTLDGGNATSLLAIDGGATLNLRHLTLAHGNSQNMQVTGGGAIWSGGVLNVDDVDFVENHAFDYGGAIYASGPAARLTVNRSRFLDNVVTCPAEADGGGAIAVKTPNPTTIDRSDFRGNRTVGEGSGGAVLGMARLYAVRRPAWNGPISVSRSTFTGNRASTTRPPSLIPTRDGTDWRVPDVPGGGAIGVYDHSLFVDSSRFADNVSTGMSGFTNGGAIIINDFLTPAEDPSFTAHPSTISGSTFTGNDAGTADGPLGLGGAVAIRNEGVLTTVTDSTFRGNRAGNGGAIAAVSALNLTGAAIADNRATATDSPTAGGVLTLAAATLRDTSLMDNSPVNCLALFSGSFVDGGGNAEQPGRTCFPATSGG